MGVGLLGVSLLGVDSVGLDRCCVKHCHFRHRLDGRGISQSGEIIEIIAWIGLGGQVNVGKVGRQIEVCLILGVPIGSLVGLRFIGRPDRCRDFGRDQFIQSNIGQIAGQGAPGKIGDQIFGVLIFVIAVCAGHRQSGQGRGCAPQF